MTWVYRPHVCNRPPAGSVIAPHGSIWECPDCGERWTLDRSETWGARYRATEPGDWPEGTEPPRESTEAADLEAALEHGRQVDADVELVRPLLDLALSLENGSSPGPEDLARWIRASCDRILRRFDDAP